MNIVMREKKNRMFQTFDVVVHLYRFYINTLVACEKTSLGALLIVSIDSESERAL
jgi:hypothetical protein